MVEEWRPVTAMQLNESKTDNIIDLKVGDRVRVEGVNYELSSRFMSCGNIHLIPIPKPKTLRPWTPEEVPVGAVVRWKDDPVGRLLIQGVRDDGLLIANVGWYSFAHCLRNYALDDGRPCGREE